MPGLIKYGWLRTVSALAVLAGLVWAERVIHRHPHFRIEETYGFFPIIGVGSVVAVVLVSRLVRLLLRREEDYYDK